MSEMKFRVADHGTRSGTTNQWRRSSSLPLFSSPLPTMSIALSPQYVAAGPSNSRRRPGLPPSSQSPIAPSNHVRSASLSSVPTTNPRFSHLLNSVLGSPFLTTLDLDVGLDNDLDLVDGSPHAVPHTHTITRPSSPAPTADFSIIDFDPDDDNARYPYRYAYHGPGRGGFGYTHQRSASSATFGRRGLSASISSPGINRSGATNTPFKSILPRIWDALSSPGRNFTPTPSPPSTPTPPSTYSTYAKGKGAVLDYYPQSARCVDYSDLAPLDGEEGELIAIDDEACFIDIRAVTGIGIIFRLWNIYWLLTRFYRYIIAAPNRASLVYSYTSLHIRLKVISSYRSYNIFGILSLFLIGSLINSVNPSS